MPSSKSQPISYTLKKKILTVLGDLEVYRYPCFLLYNPTHYKLKGEDFYFIQDHIQPFDVFLRRYDRYLDNRFVPGYWNHAGIYLPNKKVLHAIAEGVMEESLFDFMKADHICVLRPNFQYDLAVLQDRAQRLVGKEYDFDFDFSCGDKLSCTELIKEIFKDYDHNIQMTDANYILFTRNVVLPDSISQGNFSTIYKSK